MSTKLEIITAAKKLWPGCGKFYVLEDKKFPTPSRIEVLRSRYEELRLRRSELRIAIEKTKPHEALQDDLLKMVKFVLDVNGDQSALEKLAIAYEKFFARVEAVEELKDSEADFDHLRHKTVERFRYELRQEGEDTGTNRTRYARGNTLNELLGHIGAGGEHP
ncbi:MAG: hypothetical protein GXP26_13190 [Planctomycetes bacterium]|nr:hypothetical protein [Planctomycetota bacterium]